MSLPNRDPNFTLADLEMAARKFAEAGHAYFEACCKAGMSGAVIWLLSTDGSLVLFTRGEYRDVLMRNIQEIGPSRFFGTTDEG